MPFRNIRVSLDDLLLDVDNPRFIVPHGAKQEDLIKYLVEYEEIPQLADGINKSNGLSPGERIIVCTQGDKYVVLEGNRRVCACKLLVSRELAPDWKKGSFPIIVESTKLNITTIDADLVDTKEEIQSVLYRRHINGVKNWSRVSKLKFTAAEYDNGMAINDIATLVSAKPSKVKSDLRDYKLVMFALSLEEWVKHGIGTPDIQEIKPTYLTHALETKWDGTSEQSGFALLKMTCDENTKYNVVSDLPKNIFSHAIFLIAKAAFYNKTLDTRKHLSDVSELVDYLTQQGVITVVSNGETSPTSEQTGVPSMQTTQHSNGQQPSGQPRSSNDPSAQPPQPSQPSTDPKPPSDPKVLSFFENLTWSALNPALSADHNGLVALASEIKTISIKKYYGSCPIATAMLLRSLFEQSLKHYLKKKGEWNNLIAHISSKNSRPKPAGYDPMLNETIDFLRSKNRYQAIFEERTIQSAFTNATTSDMLDFFNTNIHNTHILRATKADLERRAVSGGLFSLINYILNDK